MIEIQNFNNLQAEKTPFSLPDGSTLPRYLVGNKNTIIGEPITLKNSRLRFYGINSTVIIHPDVEIFSSSIDLHDNARFQVARSSILRGGFLVHHSCSIELGERTRCNGNLNIRTAEGTTVTLGTDCLIASCTIRSSDMHPIYDIKTGERINPGKNITAGDRIWFAQDSFITKGITIGSDSVVAAHCVVTKDVPTNSIVAGNPGKIVRSNIRWHGNLPLNQYRYKMN
jgi:acetyltransferase-like isoleucine patch superfamily enzyme